MADRHPIKKAHERFYVDQFLKWFNCAYRCDFRVVSEPEPPEAIISSSRTTRWVEVTTAFWNQAYAKDLFSYATPGEGHKPIGSGPYEGIDKQFARSFASVVRKKLEKKSYIPFRDEYGAGYLIVPIKHIWFDGHTVTLMRSAQQEHPVNDLGCFRSIYIAYPSLNEIRFRRWSVKAFSTTT